MKKHLAKISGIYNQNPKGFGFVLNDEGDVYISAENKNTAFDGDLVEVLITDPYDREGEIIKILERGTHTLCGSCEAGIFMPDNKRSNDTFLITENSSSYNGQKVLFSVTDWERRLGKVILSLGKQGENSAEISAILHTYGFAKKFTDDVINEAESLLAKPKTEGREDYRKLLTVTIDGADAKDLDDAISLEFENNIYTLYVHIADVSHYVKEKSFLDNEAFERGTSCYLPDLVVPMLPEQLSNNLCSLHPLEDKLTLSAVLKFDSAGELLDFKITESVIKSDYRLVYTDVTKMLADSENELWKEYENIKPMLFSMEKLANILREKRFGNGSINLDIPESYVVMQDGEPVDIIKKEPEISNIIIEEFMIAANCAVAEFAVKNELPIIFRVHESLKKEKEERFIKFARLLGFSGSNIDSILKQADGKRCDKIVNMMLLRSMCKALYSKDNTGHFGIAAEYYCHFTSPIRRYPDLFTHRVIKSFLAGKDVSHFEKTVEEAAYNSSQREEDAENASRDAIRYETCVFMKDKIGSSFKATITSVTNFGMFLELDNTVEGLLLLEDLKDDYYIFDEERFLLYGKRKGRKYKLGDKVGVTVSSIDETARRIYFVLTEELNHAVKSNSTKQKSKTRLLRGRNVRGRNRAIRNRGKVNKTRKGKS